MIPEFITQEQCLNKINSYIIQEEEKYEQTLSRMGEEFSKARKIFLETNITDLIGVREKDPDTYVEFLLNICKIVCFSARKIFFKN